MIDKIKYKGRIYKLVDFNNDHSYHINKGVLKSLKESLSVASQKIQWYIIDGLNAEINNNDIDFLKKAIQRTQEAYKLSDGGLGDTNGLRAATAYLRMHANKFYSSINF